MITIQKKNAEIFSFVETGSLFPWVPLFFQDGFNSETCRMHHDQKCETELHGNKKSKSRFGTALASVGDINNDGYNGELLFCRVNLVCYSYEWRYFQRTSEHKYDLSNLCLLSMSVRHKCQGFLGQMAITLDIVLHKVHVQYM